MKDIEIKKENLKHGDIVWACAFAIVPFVFKYVDKSCEKNYEYSDYEKD